MKRLAFLIIAVSCAHAVAQANPTAPISPEVKDSKTVTLRLFSSLAHSVIVSGDFGDLSMTKNSLDVWSATTAPLAPAIYRYTFILDGIRVADPANPDIKGTSESLVTVPGDPAMPWELADVPHGQVTQVIYQSHAFGVQRRFFVYAPPAFATMTDKLPVLYLLHGYTDDDSSWVAVGKANLIADSLLASAKIKPMLIVMPYGQQNSRVSDREAFAPDFQEKYERQLFTEIMPYIEANFHASSEAGRRAIAGVSMGGFQAARMGMNHPETFSTVGMWSPAFFGDPSTLFGGLVGSSDDLKRSFRYVHLGVGNRDQLQFCSDAIDRFLTSKKITHDFTVTEGAHSWLVWRGYLVGFLSKFSDAANAR
jgi:enterochelin esterase family protein